MVGVQPSAHDPHTQTQKIYFKKENQYAIKTTNYTFYNQRAFKAQGFFQEVRTCQFTKLQ